MKRATVLAPRSFYVYTSHLKSNISAKVASREEYILSMLTEVRLPEWLDNYIYCELGAKYCRSNSDMTVIDWDKSDILNYLGTYFPRSYAEAYCIFSHYFTVHPDAFSGRDTLSVFDFGCGTGGEIIGLLTAVKKCFHNIKHIEVSGLDGNHHALRLLENIVERYSRTEGVDVRIKVMPAYIADFYDLSCVDDVLKESRFDIVMSFKAVCEFVTKERFEQNNAYAHLSRFLTYKLTAGGIMLLCDVTTYSNTAQEWLPMMMDKGLAEAGCRVSLRNDSFNQTFTVCHSRHSCDKSKVAWRLIKNGLKP